MDLWGNQILKLWVSVTGEHHKLVWTNLHRTIGKLARSGVPEVVLLLPNWWTGRSHFPIYSIAKIRFSNLVSLISSENSAILLISQALYQPCYNVFTITHWYIHWFRKHIPGVEQKKTSLLQVWDKCIHPIHVILNFTAFLMLNRKGVGSVNILNCNGWI